MRWGDFLPPVSEPLQPPQAGRGQSQPGKAGIAHAGSARGKALGSVNSRQEKAAGQSW